MLRPLNPDLFKQSLNEHSTSLHFLRNLRHCEVAITNYGARIVALIVPDRNQAPTDVVVGFDSLQGYLQATETYHGAIVGRYANRIARGRFSLGGQTYQLSINNPPNHLHGGPKGFNNQVWTVEEAGRQQIRLSYFSTDGEENYPGNLNVSVRYSLSEDSELTIAYEATSDRETIFNPTAHPFFNLNGQGQGTIEDHVLQINAGRYTPVDATLIPTTILPVDDTPFDFRRPKRIGADIGQVDKQLDYGAGYDHNFVLDGEGRRSVAFAKGDQTGITMEVITDQPGMQLYTGNHMKGENSIKYGLKDSHRGAFCLETQHFPDSPNHPGFPPTVLRPGEVFRSVTAYRFALTA